MTYAPLSRFAIGASALSLVALSLASLGCASSSSSGGTGGSSGAGTGGTIGGTGGSSPGTGGGAGGSVSTGGKMAAHFHGAGNPAFLQLKLPSGTNHLFARVWVYSSVQMGNGPSSDNHETLLGITGDPTGVGNQVRFGMIKGAIGTN